MMDIDRSSSHTIVLRKYRTWLDSQGLQASHRLDALDMPQVPVAARNRMDGLD